MKNSIHKTKRVREKEKNNRVKMDDSFHDRTINVNVRMCAGDRPRTLISSYAGLSSARDYIQGGPLSGGNYGNANWPV